MKRTFCYFVIFFAFMIVGCATLSGDYEKAKEINSIDSYRTFLQKYPDSQYTGLANRKLAELEESERRQNQIKENWGKLRKGMSVDEVDSLIGPLNRGAVSSIKYLFDNKNAVSSNSNAQESVDGFPYRGRYFTLQFDATGRLSEWSLK